MSSMVMFTVPRVHVELTTPIWLTDALAGYENKAYQYLAELIFV